MFAGKLAKAVRYCHADEVGGVGLGCVSGMWKDGLSRCGAESRRIVVKRVCGANFRNGDGGSRHVKWRSGHRVGDVQRCQ